MRVGIAQKRSRVTVAALTAGLMILSAGGAVPLAFGADMGVRERLDGLREKMFEPGAVTDAAVSEELADVSILQESNTWHVSPTGDDDALTCGTVTVPCRTIQHALSKAADGDLILADKAGPLDEQVVIQGRHITIRGYDPNPAQPTIGGQSMIGQAVDAFGQVVGRDIDADHVLTTTTAVLADTDGDGDLDLVTAAEGAGGGVFVIENAGGFADGNTEPVSADAGVRDIAVADINLDGHVDIVAGLFGGANQLYLNSGDGSFETGINVSDLVSNTTAVAVGDLDGDGSMDVVFGNANERNVAVFNNGDALRPFDAGSAIDIGAAVSDTTSIALADLGCDSVLDVIVGNRGSLDSLYENKNGVFAAMGLEFGDVADTVALDVGDVDADGDLDIAVGIDGGGVQLFLNTFNCGSWNLPPTVVQTVLAGDDTRDLKLRDVDADGDLDLVSATAFGTPNRLMIFDTVAGEYITGASLTGDSLGSVALDLGDVDGDGDIDLVVGNESNAAGDAGGYVNRLYVNNVALKMGRSLTIEPPRLFASPKAPVAGFAESFESGAGQFTLANDTRGASWHHSTCSDALRPGSTGALRWGNPSDCGNFGNTRTLNDVATSIDVDISACFSDLELQFDYRLDFAEQGTWDQGIAEVVIKGDTAGSTVFRAAANPGTPGGTGPLTLQNDDTWHTDQAVNLDTLLVGPPYIGDTINIAFRGRTLDGIANGGLGFVIDNVRVSCNPGMANVLGDASLVEIGSTNRDTRAVAVADVNGDGWMDVIEGNGVGQRDRLFAGKADGTFEPGYEFDTTSNSEAYSRDIEILDLDGTATLDVVVVNDGDSVTRVYTTTLGATLEFSATDYLLGVGYDVRAVASGAVDDQVGEDLVLAVSGGANVFFSGNGDGTFDAGVNITSAVSDTQDIALGDIDEDGELDVIAGNDGRNQWFRKTGPTTFAAGVDISSDDHDTVSLVVRDLNADGHLDVIAGNSITDSHLYLGDGMGAFTRAATPFAGAASTTTTEIVVADYNNDGRLDVLESFASGVPRLRINNGTADDPFYAVDPNLPPAYVPFNDGGAARPIQAAVAADLDADGWMDLVMATTNAAETAVLQHDHAQITFSVDPLRKEDFPPDAVAGALGDIDGDGRPDLVVGNDVARNRVYPNNGSARPFLETPTTVIQEFPTDGTNSRDIALGDVNGDGHFDVVEALDTNNQLYLADGSGGFLDGADLSAHAVDTRAVAMGDMDGDGDLDVVTGNFGDTSNDINRLLLNRDDGRFDSQDFPGVSSGTSSLVLADVDGDGDLDVVEGRGGDVDGITSTNHANLLYINDGRGQLGSALELDPGAEIRDTRSLAVADINNDGHLDIVAGNWMQQDAVYLGRGAVDDPADAFAAPVALSVAGVGRQTRSIALGDIDGDGTADLVVGNDNQPDQLFFGDGDGAFRGPILLSADELRTQEILLSDVDGDRDLDVVALARSNGEDLTSRVYYNRHWQNDPSANPTTRRFESLPDANAADRTHMVLADVDNDGDDDILQAVDAGPNVLMINDGFGHFESPVSIGVDSNRTIALAVADINGDGNLDVIAGNSAGSGLPNRLVLGDGTGNPFEGASGEDITSVARNTTALAVGDVDNDGDVDLVVANYGAASQVFYNDQGVLKARTGPNQNDSGEDIPNSEDVEEGALAPSNAVSDIMLADLNNDGWLDLVMVNSDFDYDPNLVFLNDGTGAFKTGIEFEQSPTIPFFETYAVDAADPDEDGDLDLVITGSSGMRLYINEFASTNVVSFTVMPLGQSGNGRDVSFADINGDGRPDLVHSAGNGGDAQVLLNDRVASAQDGVFVSPFVTETLFSGELHSHVSPGGFTGGHAVADLDGDGDLDIVSARSAGQSTILRGRMGSRVHLDGVRVTHGRAEMGGAIAHDFGALTMTWSRADASRARADGGGVYIGRSGSLDLRDSAIIGNVAGGRGGGLSFGGLSVPSIVRSTIRSNRANQGGGIYAPGRVGLEDVGVGNNRAHYAGGALLRDGGLVESSTFSGNVALMQGGGLVNDGRDLQLLNVTVSGNFARETGGGLLNEASATSRLDFVTLAGNKLDFSPGSGMRSAGDDIKGAAILNRNSVDEAFVLFGTIIADSQLVRPRLSSVTGQLETSENCAGFGLSSEGYNRTSDESCGLPDNEQAIESLVVVEGRVPALRLLADNDGKTLTHAPVISPTLSPAAGIVDVIPPSNCTATGFDQRDRTRPSIGYRDAPAEEQRTWCDVGAVEIGPATLFVCGPPMSPRTFPARCVFTSIRDALVMAEDADTVVVSGVLTETVKVDKDLTFTGPRQDEITPGTHMGHVQASPLGPTGDQLSGSVFEIDPGADVVIRNLNIRHGDAETGGGILNNGLLLLDGVTVYGNSAVAGGGVFNTSELRVVNSTIHGNEASGAGGGVHNEPGARVDMLHSTVADNVRRQGGRLGAPIDRLTFRMAKGILRPGVVFSSTRPVSDIVTAEFNGPLRLLFNNKNGTYRAGPDFDDNGYGQRTTALALGDVTGDDLVDVLTINVRDGKRQILMYEGKDCSNAGDNCLIGTRFKPAQEVEDNVGTSYSIALADLNGDDKLDLIVGGFGQRHKVLINRGSGLGAAVEFGAADDYPLAIDVGDFNEDDAPDLVVGSLWGDADRIYMNEGTDDWATESSPTAVGFPVEGTPLTTPTSGASFTYDLKAVDVTEDGILDVVTANVSGRPSRVFVGVNDGTFMAPVDFETGSDSLYAVAAGRLDGGNGATSPDIVGGLAGLNRLYRGAPFSDIQTLGISDLDHSTTYSIVLDDVDDDGDIDILTGNNGPDRLYLNSGFANAPFEVEGELPSNLSNSDTMSTTFQVTNTIVSTLVVKANQCGGDPILDGGGNRTHNGACFSGPAAGTTTLAMGGPTTGLFGRIRSGLGRLFGRGLDGLSGAQRVNVDDVGGWTPTADMALARERHAAALLRTPSGNRLLVTGGITNTLPEARTASAADYITSTNTWTTRDELALVRSGHTANLVNTNSSNRSEAGAYHVLVVGGVDDNGTVITGTELYSPTIDAWIAFGDLNEARQDHTTTLLPEGEYVLAVGGNDGTTALDSFELSFIDNGTWTIGAPTMNVGRARHTTVLVPRESAERSAGAFGNVLVIGGEDNSQSPLDSVELMEVGFQSWQVREDIPMARSRHTASVITSVPLLRGNVIVVGGAGSGGSALNDVRMYDPVADEWSLLPPMLSGPRKDHTATTLDDGRILIVGGRGAGGPLSSAEIFDPSTMEWSPAGTLVAPRADHTATLMDDGRVIVTGGQSFGGETSKTAEVFSLAAEGAAGNSIGEPFLRPLRDNGGPTLTRAYLDNSPAKDAGLTDEAGACLIEVDQRGKRRPHDAGCDIGAFESGRDVYVVCPTCQDDPANNEFNDLQQALNYAFAGDTIQIGAGEYSGPLVTYKDLTLEHAGVDYDRMNFSTSNDVRAVLQSSEKTVFEQDQLRSAAPGAVVFGPVLTSKAFAYPQGAESAAQPVADSGDVALTIRGLTIRNGFARRGAGVFSLGRLRVYTSTITDNAAVVEAPVAGTVGQASAADGGRGGGIYSAGELSVVQSTIHGNRAERRGGGIYVDGAVDVTGRALVSGNARIISSTVTENRAAPLGVQHFIRVNDNPNGSARPVLGGGLVEGATFESGDRLLLLNSHTQKVVFTLVGEGCSIDGREADEETIEVDPLQTSSEIVCVTDDVEHSIVLSASAGGINLDELMFTVRLQAIDSIGHSLMVVNRGQASLRANILTNSEEEPNCAVDAGSRIESLGYNVSNDTACSLAGNGDLETTTAAIALGPLQDNNWVDNRYRRIAGLTFTRALAPNSIAIDRIPAESCSDVESHVIDIENANAIGGEPQMPVQSEPFADQVIEAGDVLRWHNRTTVTMTVAIDDGESDVQLIEVKPGETSREVEFPGDEVQTTIHHYRVYEHATLRDVVTQTLTAAKISVVGRRRVTDQRGVSVHALQPGTERKCDSGAYEFQPWVVGQALPRPPMAVDVEPPIWRTDDTESASATLPFHRWSPGDNTDYVTRPTQNNRVGELDDSEMASVTWLVNPDPLDRATMAQSGIVVWPERMQLHTSKTPVSLDHDGIDDGYTIDGPSSQAFEGLNHLSELDSIIQAGVFSRTLSGASTYSVLQFAKPNNGIPTYRVDVVRTVDGDSPGVRDVSYNENNLNCVIGEELAYNGRYNPDAAPGEPDFVAPGHVDPEGRPGYILQGRAYDGVETKIDLATVRNTGDGLIPPVHVRQDRTGHIIPVLNMAPVTLNRVVDPDDVAGPILGEHDLKVAWYRPDSRNVAWAVKSVGYRCDWPEDPDEIVIASELGSEIEGQALLDAERYLEATVYSQTDRRYPGFNPNDEHALLAPSNTGEPAPALYALRDDLAPPDNAYALLKFKDALLDEKVRIKPYKVMLTRGAEAISAVTETDEIIVFDTPDAARQAGEAAREGSAAVRFGPAGTHASSPTVRVGGGAVPIGGRLSVPLEITDAKNLRTAVIKVRVPAEISPTIACRVNTLDFVEKIHGLGVTVTHTARLHDPTSMQAVVAAGSDVQYRWFFGANTPRIDGPLASHVYPSDGPNQVQVQAFNSRSGDDPDLFDSVTTSFSIPSNDDGYAGYLPQPDPAVGCHFEGAERDVLVFDVQTRAKHGLSGDLQIADITVTGAMTSSERIELEIVSIDLESPAYEELRFDTVAGNPIFAPTPVRNLLDVQACTETKPESVDADPFWKDFKGQLWARAAGSMNVLYYYPMQLGFYIPSDNDVLSDLNTALDLDLDNSDRDEGKCVPWLHKGPASLTVDDPQRDVEVLPVSYVASWPFGPPLLSVGETVYERSKSGISGVANQLAVSRVYDDLAPGYWDGKKIAVSGPEADRTIADIIDPIRAVRVPLDLRPKIPGPGGVMEPDPNANFSLPDALKTQRKLFGGGVEILGDVGNEDSLPFALRARVAFDDNQGELVLTGYYDGTSKEYVKGDPLLLLNVLTAADKNRMQNICVDKDEADRIDDQKTVAPYYGFDQTKDCGLYKAAVEDLYHKSRNPRGLDLCRTSNGSLLDEGMGPVSGTVDPGHTQDKDDAEEEVKALKAEGKLPQKFESVCPVGPGSNDESWRDGKPDLDLLIGLQDEPSIAESLAAEKVLTRSLTVGEVNDGMPEPFEAVGQGAALSAGGSKGQGYITLAYNNDPDLGGLPVSLQVIKVGCTKNHLGLDSTYRGNVLVLKSDNIFDEKLTLRHTGDFGGRADEFEFEWFIAPVDDTAVSPTTLPPSYPWQRWTRKGPDDKDARDEIVIEGANPTTLRDNWVIVRYKGYPVCGNEFVPSAFAGDPSAKPSEVRAQLAPGWIKRVTSGLNPFDTRVDDFVSSPVNTNVNMIRQAGKRFEGPIAFNPSPDNLNSVGLIEAYETVLQRGRILSIENNINDQGANAALVNVTSRIAGLYQLIGNDAYMDALDPTTGLGTDSSVGQQAPAIHAFMNQYRSDQFGLIDEELGLLRGRDETLGGVAAAPNYNRLTWNFSNGLDDGEVAYVLNYNIGDSNRDGFIDEADAAIEYPQGHGDAWGHMLTAVKKYYQLVNHPSFTWISRAEPVLVGGAPLVVDYYDERRFALAAANKARVGAEMVNLLHRKHVVEPDNPARMDHYVDPSDRCVETYAAVPDVPASARDTIACAERAWGVTDWAKRAGAGAYLDWVVGNTMLPPVEERFDDVRKIDRTTVAELQEIVDQYDSIEAQLDKVDQGVNPLGVADGTVLFDLDPARTKTSAQGGGLTHFEQVNERAVFAVRNAITVFDNANRLKIARRNAEASQDDFRNRILEKDQAMINSLIQSFGYPYDADIGINGVYPEGYEGPDIYNYDLYDRIELTDFRERCTEAEIKDDAKLIEDGKKPTNCAQANKTITVRFKPFDCIGYFVPTLEDPANGCSIGTELKKPYPEGKEYAVGSGLLAGYGRFKPDSWEGSARKAPGAIQDAIVALYQSKLEFERTIADYEGHVQAMDESALAIQDFMDLQNEKGGLQLTRNVVVDIVEGVLLSKQIAAKTGNQIATTMSRAGFVAGDCPPKAIGFSNDAGSPVGCAVALSPFIASQTFTAGASALEVAADWIGYGKDVADRALEDLLFGLEADYETKQMVREMAALIRDEEDKRIAMFLAEDVFINAAGDYDAALQTGFRTLEELIRLRKQWAGQVQKSRYNDMAYRVFQNAALEQYRGQFDQAQLYTYLAAAAYDYETNLDVDSPGSGLAFQREIVGMRSLGEVKWVPGVGSVPVAGPKGLADPLARMGSNFAVLKGQMGFNNPQEEQNAFSLRHELFRLREDSDAKWRHELQRHYRADIFSDPRVSNLAQRPFGQEGPQPGLVIPFAGTIVEGLNFFGNRLGAGDNAYDATQYATKIHSVGVWFDGYDPSRLSNSPRVYVLPSGDDVMRPRDTRGVLRFWNVREQLLPLPFEVGEADLADPSWSPRHDGLNGNLFDMKRYSRLRAYPLPADGQIRPDQLNTDTRLIGRSVWNTEWLVVVPGSSLLADSDVGVERFIRDVDDIRIFFQTYAYAGRNELE